MQTTAQEQANLPLGDRVNLLLEQWTNPGCHPMTLTANPTENLPKQSPPSPYLMSRSQWFLPPPASAEPTDLLTHKSEPSSFAHDVSAARQLLPNISRDGDKHVALRYPILRLEAAMRELVASGRAKPINCSWRHHFAPGIYVREITMPAGYVVTGRIHRHEHLNIIHRGHVTVVTQDGVQDIRPDGNPFVMVSPAGMKRALYTHEETVWSTIHLNPTDERDPDKLVEMLTCVSFEELA